MFNNNNLTLSILLTTLITLQNTKTQQIEQSQNPQSYPNLNDLITKNNLEPQKNLKINFNSKNIPYILLKQQQEKSEILDFRSNALNFLEKENIQKEEEQNNLIDLLTKKLDTLSMEMNTLKINFNNYIQDQNVRYKEMQMNIIRNFNMLNGNNNYNGYNSNNNFNNFNTSSNRNFNSGNISDLMLDPNIRNMEMDRIALRRNQNTGGFSDDEQRRRDLHQEIMRNLEGRARGRLEMVYNPRINNQMMSITQQDVRIPNNQRISQDLINLQQGSSNRIQQSEQIEGGQRNDKSFQEKIMEIQENPRIQMQQDTRLQEMQMLEDERNQMDLDLRSEQERIMQIHQDQKLMRNLEKEQMVEMENIRQKNKNGIKGNINNSNFGNEEENLDEVKTNNNGASFESQGELTDE